jgi:hypothetical protein
MGANVMMASNNIQLAVAKPKKQIVQSLDQKEKDVLNNLKNTELEKFQDHFDKKYHDKFNCKLVY